MSKTTRVPPPAGDALEELPFEEALQRLDESLSFLIVPYTVSSIAVSLISDVFPYIPVVSAESSRLAFSESGEEKPIL